MELANELYARSLISEDMKDWVETARGVSAGDMASRMLSNVEATLRAAPQALEVITAFFEVIWWAEHTLSHVLKEMEEELQQEPWGVFVCTCHSIYTIQEHINKPACVNQDCQITSIRNELY